MTALITRILNMALNVLIVPLAFTILLYAFWKYELASFLYQPLAQDKEIFYYNFSYGSNIDNLIRDFDDKGILRRPLYFSVYARLLSNSRSLKAGLYKINPAIITPQTLLVKLEKGLVERSKIRLPAGYNIRKTINKVKHNKKIRQTMQDVNQNNIMRLLGLPDVHPEGQFFPDTYVIQPGIADITLLRTAYEAMQLNLQREWEKHDLHKLQTPYQALILASIIEKETADAEEKFIISGVFYNRLKKKMRLQTDPTVIYGMGEKYNGDITKKDLRTDTPYNTYTRKGLPPTPISMPSLSSIKAALNPAKTDALFFVAKGGGKHYFSKTYAEHKKAVYKYQTAPYLKRQKIKLAKEKLAKAKLAKARLAKEKLAKEKLAAENKKINIEKDWDAIYSIVAPPDTSQPFKKLDLDFSID